MKYNIGKGDKIIIDKNNIKFADKKNFWEHWLILKTKHTTITHVI